MSVRRLLPQIAGAVVVVAGCASGSGAPGGDPLAGERDQECVWESTITVYVQNGSSMDIEVSFGDYTPARLAAGFETTTYRVARGYLEGPIGLRIARGGLQTGDPPAIPTEPVPCDVATLVIGSQPRYSFFYGSAPLGRHR